MKCDRCGRPIPTGNEACPSGGKPGEDGLFGLVALAREGNQQALSALYEKTYNGVFYTIKSMIKDEDTVLDLLQDTYVKAFTHLDHFQGDTKFSPWVRQIGANTARDYLRKKKPMLFTDLAAGEEPNEPIEEHFADLDVGNLPDEVLDRAETTRLIREIIDGLPEDQRAVIGMYYYQEMPVKDIAAALGASESAVKSRLLYGRRKIEAQVRDLEKKGTKLYGLAPIPFLLWLMGAQEAQAAQLPNGQILQHVLASAGQSGAAGAGTASAAGTGAASQGEAAAAVGTKAAAGGLGAAKLGLIAVAAVAVIGAGVYGVSRLSQPAAGPGETSHSSVSVSDGSASVQTEEGNPADQALEQALEQYRLIVSQADSYSYSSYPVTPTGYYRYALVQLEPDNPVPTLLLSQEGDDFSNRVRLFQYDPDAGLVIQPEEALEEYGGGGGYASGLSLQGDGMGLGLSEISGGTGSTVMTRITLQNGALVREEQWSGRMDAADSEKPDFVDIPWHDITDTSALDRWTPEAGISQQGGSSSSAGDGTESGLPTDGDRIVFTGTVGTYSYEEVIALQGCPDPNAPWSDSSQTFRLIVLDTPQEMELQSGDPVGSPRSDTVRLISVAYAEGLEQYDGHHLTFSIDPKATYWPSDSSMPVGQPSTRDVHVLK